MAECPVTREQTRDYFRTRNFNNSYEASHLPPIPVPSSRRERGNYTLYAWVWEKGTDIVAAFAANHFDHVMLFVL